MAATDHCDGCDPKTCLAETAKDLLNSVQSQCGSGRPWSKGVGNSAVATMQTIPTWRIRQRRETTRDTLTTLVSKPVGTFFLLSEPVAFRRVYGLESYSRTSGESNHHRQCVSDRVPRYQLHHEDDSASRVGTIISFVTRVTFNPMPRKRSLRLQDGQDMLDLLDQCNIPGNFPAT